jgi:hypothetical protein
MDVPGWVVILFAAVGMGVWAAYRRLTGKGPLASPGTWLMAGLFCLGSAVGLGGCAFNQVERVKQVQAWPTTTGVVIESKLLVSHRHPDLTDPGRVQEPGIHIERARTEYDADIRYRYEVSGAGFEGRSVTPGNVAVDDDVRRWVAKYPKGSKVTVHYNPARPTDAVLESGAEAVRQTRSAALGLGFFGVALLGIGIFCKAWVRSGPDRT